MLLACDYQGDVIDIVRTPGRTEVVIDEGVREVKNLLQSKREKQNKTEQQ